MGKSRPQSNWISASQIHEFPVLVRHSHIIMQNNDLALFSQFYTLPVARSIGNSVLSISFEVDVSSEKVGGSTYISKFSGGHAPRKFWNLDAWKCYFQRFPDSIIKTKTISTIVYVSLNRFFFPLKSQSLAFRKEWNDKSSNADSKKKFTQCFKFMLSFWKKRAQQCLCRFLWRGCHFGTFESLRSSPVKMAQAFHDPSIRFNFLHFHLKDNTFKTPEMYLYLDSDVCAWCFTIIFVESFHYVKPVSCCILFCQNVASVPRPFDQLSSHVGKANTFKTSEMRLYFDLDVWGGCVTIIFCFCWIFSLFKLSYQH